MRRILSKILPVLSRNQNQQSENQKVSYWLEKLVTQQDAEQKSDLPQQTTLPLNTPVQPLSAQDQASEKKGVEQAVKNHAGKAEKDRQSLQDMANNSNRILLQASSVFPWDLFPSSIIVEETRITIVHRQLFASQVHSLNIKDVANIFIDTSILFAQLTIVSDTYAENEIIVGRLWKKDAILIRRVIEGLRMFVNKDIDTTAYTVEDLLHKVKELSTTGIVL